MFVCVLSICMFLFWVPVCLSTCVFEYLYVCVFEYLYACVFEYLYMYVCVLSTCVFEYLFVYVHADWLLFLCNLCRISISLSHDR